MKVLFQNRDPKSWIGGDQVQLEKTRQALPIETSFSFDIEYSTDADIVHCFNFSMPWTKYQIWNAKRQGKKVVCSMIYHEMEDFIPYTTQQAMINELDACIFLTQGELERVRRHMSVPDEKIHFIPNGIEEWWFDHIDDPIPCEVLTVGRIDANKGQLAVAKACRELGLKYTCIGNCDPAYALLLELEGATVLAPMEHKELKRYYAGCQVFALVSYKELMPLTVMEAGSQGKNIVLTTGCEWEIDCDRAEYNNVESIEKALLKAIERPENTDFRDKLKGMTWDKVAKQLMDIYAKIH